MPHRTIIGSIVLSLRTWPSAPVVLLALSGALCDTAGTAASPNVIIVMTDDQGYGEFLCHGNPLAQTPHIDRLAIRAFTQLETGPLELQTWKLDAAGKVLCGAYYVYVTRR